MRVICILLALAFSISCFGEESSGYAMLTNKLSLCIANDGWHYVTNEVGRIRKITIRTKVDEQFSDEIVAALQQCCPKEWNDAVSSAGNADNPKMVSLRQYFDNAVLRTPTIIRFKSFAENNVGRGIVLKVRHEKLSYTAQGIDQRQNGKRIIRCFLWIEVCCPLSNPGIYSS